MTESGMPFFWLGDTAWELFHRLTLEEADFYLQNRAQKGFNVIQAVILAERDGLHAPNPYGHTPLLNDDPTHLNEAYFAYVDAVIRLAESKGLYIGLLPTWGDKVDLVGGSGPLIFNPQNAYAYGELLGARYRNQPNIIWILGGDRYPDGFEPIWRAMAQGILAGAGDHAIITYHPRGPGQSSVRLHDESWLSLNLIQSGHGKYNVTNWEWVAQDYARTPAKPTLDSEPNYEDHPVAFDSQVRSGRFTDYDVRKAAYRAVLSGACGHTYGHHSIWQMYDQRYEPVVAPDRTWQQALDRPGAFQMLHLRRLIESRPFFTRVPGDHLLVAPPQDAPSHVAASTDTAGTYALIYIPTAAQTITVNLAALSGNRFKTWWYDPRSGVAAPSGEILAAANQSFTSPATEQDWVLVIDSLDAGYLPPGQV